MTEAELALLETLEHRRVRQLVQEHRALKAEVVKALNQVGNLRVICPELAALVGACEEQ